MDLEEEMQKRPTPDSEGCSCINGRGYCQLRPAADPSGEPQGKGRSRVPCLSLQDYRLQI